MERQSGGLGTRIIYHLRNNREARHACNSDDMAMILLNHSRQKLFDREKVRDDIHVKSSADLLL